MLPIHAWDAKQHPPTVRRFLERCGHTVGEWSHWPGFMIVDLMKAFQIRRILEAARFYR